jgi:hypothetical protein
MFLTCSFVETDLAALKALVDRTIDISYAGVYPSAVIKFFREYHHRENILADAQAGPQDFAVRTVAGKTGIWYRNTRIVIAEPEQAELNHTQPAALAQIWLANLRKAMLLPSRQK